MHTIILDDRDFKTLLETVKADINAAFDDGLADVMQEDIDLLHAIARSFKDENARLQLQTIISGYERDLRSIS